MTAYPSAWWFLLPPGIVAVGIGLGLAGGAVWRLLM
jgi:hypothetical protein